MWAASSHFSLSHFLFPFSIIIKVEHFEYKPLYSPTDFFFEGKSE